MVDVDFSKLAQEFKFYSTIEDDDIDYSPDDNGTTSGLGKALEWLYHHEMLNESGEAMREEYERIYNCCCDECGKHGTIIDGLCVDCINKAVR